MALDPERGEAWVVTRGGQGAAARQAFGRRWVVGSCCGKGRLSLIWDTDLRTVRPLSPSGGPRLTPASCRQIMAALEASAREGVFGLTGGVHSAGLATPDGQLVVTRADIGRHNALDKLYGYALLRGLDPSGMVVAFSGRLS